jgi:hypothetical protein
MLTLKQDVETSVGLPKLRQPDFYKEQRDGEVRNKKMLRAISSKSPESIDNSV